MRKGEGEGRRIRLRGKRPFVVELIQQTQLLCVLHAQLTGETGEWFSHELHRSFLTYAVKSAIMTKLGGLLERYGMQ